MQSANLSALIMCCGFVIKRDDDDDEEEEEEEEEGEFSEAWSPHPLTSFVSS